MTKFTDNLWRDLAREHGPALEQAGGPRQRRTRRPGPRVIAGSTLAVVAVAAGLTLGLTSTGSTATSTAASTAVGSTRVVTAAYTITKSSSSVLVQMGQAETIEAVNQKLSAMGLHESVILDIKSGPATVSGPVTCTPAQGASQPTLKVLLGTNGTQIIPPGATADNTGEGTWHLAACKAWDGIGNTGIG